MAARRAKKLAYHHGDLRRALLDAALGMVAEQGTGAVSLRELAERVGVSHAAPYRHFRNKETLFATVAMEGFKLLREAMIAGRDRGGSGPRARLLGIGVAYVRFAVAHPGHFKVMFSHVGHPPPDLPQVTREGGGAFGVLVEAVVAAQNGGIVRKGDPIPHSVFCWSGCHGLATLAIEECLAPLGIRTPVEKQAAQLVEDLLDGLAPRRK